MTTDDRVLTSAEIASRTSRSAQRTLAILMDVRQTSGLYEEVHGLIEGRGLLEVLAAEVALWGAVATKPAVDTGARIYWCDLTT